MGYAQAATRVYQYVPDSVLQLANAEYRRKLSIGNQWRRLRIGFLAAVTPNGVAGSIVNCRCFFGMASSTGGGSSEQITANFIGVCLMGAPTVGGDLTYNANVYPNPYYSLSSEQCFAKAVSTITLAGADTGALVWSPYSVGNYRRFPYILDISRATVSGTYTLSVYGLNSFGVAVDHRPDHLMTCLDTLGTPTSNGVVLTVMCSARTITWNETGGPLDMISLYWNKSTFPLELSAVGGVLIDN